MYFCYNYVKNTKEKLEEHKLKYNHDFFLFLEKASLHFQLMPYILTILRNTLEFFLWKMWKNVFDWKLLNTHTRKLHSEPAKCGKDFINSSNFQKHMREKHMAENDFSSNLCDKIFQMLITWNSTIMNSL